MNKGLMFGIVALGAVVLSDVAEAQVAIAPTPPVYQNTNPSGNVLRTNSCGDARHQAIAQGTANPLVAVECNMLTGGVMATVRFDRTGSPIAITAVDAQGVGRHVEVTHDLVHGVYVNNKNYRGPIAEVVMMYYESQPSMTRVAPGTVSANPTPTASTDLVLDGRLYHAISSSRVQYQFANAQAHLEVSTFTGPEQDDHCMMFYKSGESTNVSDPTVLLTHFDTVGTRHEQARWDGKSPVSLHCGSYLSAPVADPAIYADVFATYMGTMSQLQANYRTMYRSWGLNYDTNAIGLLSAAHQTRLSFGLHPVPGTLSTMSGPGVPAGNAGWLGDGWSPHGQAMIDSALINAAYAAGAGFVTGAMTGGPAGAVVGAALAGAAVFVGSMAASFVSDMDQGIDPRTGEPFTSENIDRLTSDDINQLASWDGDANSPNNPDDSADPSGGASDGAGDYEGGESGCDANDPSCSASGLNVGGTTPRRPPPSGGSCRGKVCQ